MKLSCCGAFGKGYIEAEFIEPSGEARGQAGALGALEVVGAEVMVIHPAPEHDVCQSPIEMSLTLPIRDVTRGQGIALCLPLGSRPWR